MEKIDVNMFTAAKNHKTEETLMKEGGLKISRSVTNLCSHIVCCVCLYIQTRRQREHRIWVIYKRMFVLFLALCAMYIKWAHPGGVFNSKRVCGSAGWLSKRAEGGSAEATAQLAPSYYWSSREIWYMLKWRQEFRWSVSDILTTCLTFLSAIYVSLRFVDWNFQKIQFQLTNECVWWDEMRGGFDLSKLDFKRFQRNEVNVKRFPSLLFILHFALWSDR